MQLKSSEKLQPNIIPLKDFKELNRLSYVVRKIEDDNHIVPEGGYKLTPMREVRKNDEFRGKHIR